ncbi:MAG: hypothetical protein AAFV98_13130 [Chloroflexota bacterium]
MPTPEEIQLNKERLYESSSLTDDLNDAEAQVLLKWGEAQVERLAESYAEEFEQKARFLRQLMKNINRFVGQREFNEMDGQQKYMSNVVKYLEPLGWQGISSAELFTALPADKTDMAGNLDAILAVLNARFAPTPVEDTPLTNTLPDTDTALPAPTSITEDNSIELENPNDHSINLSDIFDFGDSKTHGEEQE